MKSNFRYKIKMLENNEGAAFQFVVRPATKEDCEEIRYYYLNTVKKSYVHNLGLSASSFVKQPLL